MKGQKLRIKKKRKLVGEENKRKEGERRENSRRLDGKEGKNCQQTFITSRHVAKLSTPGLLGHDPELLGHVP